MTDSDISVLGNVIHIVRQLTLGFFCISFGLTAGINYEKYCMATFAIERDRYTNYFVFSICVAVALFLVGAFF